MTGVVLESDLDRNALAYVRRWVVAGTGLVIFGYAVALGTEAATSGIGLRNLGEFVTFFGAFLGLGFTLRDHVRIGAVVIVALVWLELHVAVFLEGGIPDSGTPVLPVVVFATVLFLGVRPALLLASATAVLYPISAWLGAMVWDSGPPIEEALVLVVLIITLFAAGVLGHIGMRSFGRLLREAMDNERKLSSLVRHAPVGIVVLDAAGCVESVNPEAAKLLGLTEETLLHERFSDTLAPLSLQGRSDLPSFDAASGSIGPVELVLAPDEQTRVNVELVSSRTVLGDGSEGTQVILRNVTEQRKAERRAARITLMYDESQSEAYAFDVETLRVSFVNRATRVNLGYEPAELETLTVTDINPLLDAKRVRRLVAELSGKPDSPMLERGKHTRKDGSSYPVELRQQMLSVDGRQTIAVLALDITNQLESETEQQQLRDLVVELQKTEAIGRLAGSVAHDFNNVLEAIGGYAEFIKESSSEQNVRDWADSICRAQERGASLTRGLLGLVHQGMVHQKSVSLSATLRDLEASIQSMVGDRITLTLETSARDSVYLDRAQIENLILNLVGNAADAMPEGGLLKIGIRSVDSPGRTRTVSLEVTDTGVGMDESTRRRAIEPFFTTKPIGRGTGLGLSSVHGTVTLSDGTMELRSKPGEGTTVRIEWPSADDAADETETAVRAPISEPRAVSTGNILVVEDDEGTRGLLERVLARAGYDVQTAESAEEGMEWLNGGHRIDMLLTDVALPGRSGFELGEEVQKLIPGLPVLFMSGYLMSGWLDNLATVEGGAVDLGMDLLLKPFSASDLLDRVENALAGTR